jgi:hypothetical protein
MNRIGLPVDKNKSQQEAQEMYHRIWTMKMLPPGRGLWAMGSTLTTDRGIYAALNNCAFVSTTPIKEDDPADTYCFCMDSSMLGIGVGFDCAGAGAFKITTPGIPFTHVVSDSREGWVHSLRILLWAFFKAAPLPIFDYSSLRPAGAAIIGFGGVSQGAEPLRALHEGIIEVLAPMANKYITSRAIVDIFNMIGRCVVAGNVRRSAEIAFGDPDDQEFLHLKDYTKNPERAAYGWASNNSVLGKLGMDYADIADSICKNGEPGLVWLENIRKFGRMGDAANDKDYRAAGCNPCVEESIYPHICSICLH